MKLLQELALALTSRVAVDRTVLATFLAGESNPELDGKPIILQFRDVAEFILSTLEREGKINADADGWYTLADSVIITHLSLRAYDCENCGGKWGGDCERCQGRGFTIAPSGTAMIPMIKLTGD